MNQKHFYRNFFFTLLLGILAISGVSAKEQPLFTASEGEVSVSELVDSADESPFWTVQEAYSEYSLPEYSENQFFEGILLFRKSGSLPPIGIPSASFVSRSGRDLRAAISIQIFPFHFFL